MTIVNVWEVLELEPTRDVGAIRKAYAARLRTTNPEDDQAKFKLLRGAYEFALGWATTAEVQPGAEALGPAGAAPDGPDAGATTTPGSRGTQAATMAAALLAMLDRDLGSGLITSS